MSKKKNANGVQSDCGGLKKPAVPAEITETANRKKPAGSANGANSKRSKGK